MGRHGFAGDGPSYNVNQQFANGTYPLQGKFTYPGYIDPATGQTLVCCTTGVNNYLGNNANSNYNALQAKFNQNFSNGLQFITHFTWSRALHYDSNYFADVQKVAYGPDDQNRTLVWVFSGVYQPAVWQGPEVRQRRQRSDELTSSAAGKSASPTTGQRPAVDAFSEQLP